MSRLQPVATVLWAVAVAVAAAGCVFDDSGLAGSDGGSATPDALVDVATDATPADRAAADAAGADGAADDAPGPVDGPTGDAAALDASPLDGGPADSMVDSGPEAAASDGPSCAPWSFTPSNFDPCDSKLPAPGNYLVLGAGSWEFDTDDGSLLLNGTIEAHVPSAAIPQTSGPDVRVMATGGFLVDTGAILTVTGSLPLIIAAHGDATVRGEIDVSARTGGAGGSTAGPGGDDQGACGAGAGEPGGDSASATAGAGGGGGGAFGANGGDGGDGHGGSHGVGGAKGTANGAATIVPLRGGCPGGVGGAPVASSTVPLAGRAGAGGGAVQIAVRDSLSVEGVIRSAGAGGGGGRVDSTTGRAGGGGAGSGGAIFLEASKVTVTATASLCANGGAGGEGSDASLAGASGQPGTCSSTLGATCTGVAPGGGNGGAGGYAAKAATNGANGTSGGGGGGGGAGVGRIRVRGVGARVVDAAAVVTPPAAS